MNDRLIKYLRNHNIDTDKLSERTGISKCELDDILNNNRKASLQELGRIATKLHITLDVISEEEDIQMALDDANYRDSKEKKAFKVSIPYVVLLVFGICLVLWIATGFIFQRVVRIECKYKDMYLKEEIKYSLTTRDIKLYRKINDDGNEYDKIFYDIHLSQVKKNYHGKCVIEQRKGMKLWKLD